MSLPSSSPPRDAMILNSSRSPPNAVEVERDAISDACRGLDGSRDTANWAVARKKAEMLRDILHKVYEPLNHLRVIHY